MVTWCVASFCCSAVRRSNYASQEVEWHERCLSSNPPRPRHVAVHQSWIFVLNGQQFSVDKVAPTACLRKFSPRAEAVSNAARYHSHAGHALSDCGGRTCTSIAAQGSSDIYRGASDLCDSMAKQQHIRWNQRSTWHLEYSWQDVRNTAQRLLMRCAQPRSHGSRRCLKGGSVARCAAVRRLSAPQTVAQTRSRSCLCARSRCRVDAQCYRIFLQAHLWWLPPSLSLRDVWISDAVHAVRCHRLAMGLSK